MNNLIHGYALGLFQIAKEEDKLAKYKNSALQMIDLLKQNKKILRVWDDKGIPLRDKEQMIKKIFKGYPKFLVVFLLLLSKKRKSTFFIKIIENFIKKTNKELNIHEGTIYSVLPLTPKQIEEIKEKVSKLLNMKVKLENLIDKTLVSGVKIVVEDKIIEDSLFTRMESMKNELLVSEKGDN